MKVTIIARDVKNPHVVGIPAGATLFWPPRSGTFSRVDVDEDKIPPMAGSGTGAGIVLPAPRGPRIYEKTILPLINISNIYIYRYFYVISYLFNLIIKNISNISNPTDSHSHSLI